MAACFAGQSCRRCGGPAERLVHGRFYCGRHCPAVRSAQAEAAPKVYRCSCGPWASGWPASAARGRRLPSGSASSTASSRRWWPRAANSKRHNFEIAHTDRGVSGRR